MKAGVFIFDCCATNYHKFSNLKKCILLSRSFHGSGVQAWLSWAPCLFSQALIKVLVDVFSFGRLGERICCKLIWVVVAIHFLVAAGLRALASYWLSPGGCLQFPARGPLCRQFTMGKFASSRLAGESLSVAPDGVTHSLMLSFSLSLLSPVMGGTYSITLFY